MKWSGGLVSALQSWFSSLTLLYIVRGHVCVDVRDPSLAGAASRVLSLGRQELLPDELTP